MVFLGEALNLEGPTIQLSGKGGYRYFLKNIFILILEEKYNLAGQSRK
jgi:hypothetical protein